MCFKLKLIKNGLPDHVLGKYVISAVDKCKYLGIIVSEANCDGDLKMQMRKYYANANMLLRKFSYCSPDVNLNVACLNLTVLQCIVLLCGLIVPLHR